MVELGMLFLKNKEIPPKPNIMIKLHNSKVNESLIKRIKSSIKIKVNLTIIALLFIFCSGTLFYFLQNLK